MQPLGGLTNTLRLIRSPAKVLLPGKDIDLREIGKHILKEGLITQATSMAERREEG